MRFGLCWKALPSLWWWEWNGRPGRAPRLPQEPTCGCGARSLMVEPAGFAVRRTWGGGRAAEAHITSFTESRVWAWLTCSAPDCL